MIDLLRRLGPTFLLCLPLVSSLSAPLVAQDSLSRVRVQVRDAEGPIEGAQVGSGGTGALTDEAGDAVIELSAGPATIRVERIGYGTAEVSLEVPARDTSVVVVLAPEAVEAEGIVVMSTRADRRIEDEPLRVEVIEREEVEEKLLMTPGDIAMLLNETAGLRVQPTAPSLGGATVRVQGLRGRYTQILSDGLPLHGGQTGALGPLQIPPMDLGQVEVIKGVASALYGSSALGGVVNLISRRPNEDGEREVLLNQTTLGGTDAIAWGSGALGARWGYTLLAGAHRQARADVDEDGWADLPRFRRALLRPRLFWNGSGGSSAFVTLGGMMERREGGTVPGRLTPDGTSFREALDTDRLDGGGVARLLLGESRLLTVRGSGALQRHDHSFGGTPERDRHVTGFVEATLSGTAGAHTWVVGGAIQRDAYDALSLDGFDYTHTVPGVFVQDELSPWDLLTVALSGRVDHHGVYGNFFNPRVSVLLRPAGGWTLRASAGTGYFAPTPWTEETEAVGLSRLVPPNDLHAERARSASLDVGRTAGPFELNATLFGSVIDGPVQARPAATGAGRIELYNAEGDVRTWGTELLARYHDGPVHVTATHVRLDSTEPRPDGPGRRDVPLTPRHTAGVVGAWEQEGRGRVGVELYYTGRQALEENPYREASRPHVIVGLLVERRLGPVRVFLNAENLLDARQTRYDPLVRPARSPEGRWLTDVWAPLEGRSFNAGVRWEL